MQIELTLTAPEGSDYAASDLGFLLHKHPAHLHERDVSGEDFVRQLFEPLGYSVAVSVFSAAPGRDLFH